MEARFRHAQYTTRDLDRQSFGGHHCDRREASFAVRTLLQQLRRPTMHRQLGLQLTDPLAGHDQLSAFTAVSPDQVLRRCGPVVATNRSSIR